VSQKKKKKVISTSDTKKNKVSATGGTKKKIKPTKSKRGTRSTSTSTASQMLFGRENFKWMFIGLAFIAVGMALMSGGAMPSPDVWDESLIYSARRITLAPMIILIGLGIEIYAIFK